MGKANSKREAIRGSVQNLLRTVNSLQSLLIGIHELPGLGFTPVRVELDAEKQSLKFDPSFFYPLPQSVLTEHPLYPDEYEPVPLTEDDHISDDTIHLSDLRHELREECGMAVPEEVVRERYLKDLWEGKTDDASETRNTSNYIYYFFDAYRIGDSEYTRLWDFTPIKPISWTEYESSLDVGMFAVVSPQRKHWRLDHKSGDASGEVPHSICIFRQDYAANDESITIGELQGIMRVMHIHYRRRHLKQHDLLPLLAISYTGPRHGRIIQAHHDGETMVLQYSPLLSFVHKETAPVSLFLRYNTSLPLYPTTTKPLCIR